eukprot:COSAG06_NODE_45069_length_358_cov_0.482625_2_plen_21_part_01
MDRWDGLGMEVKGFSFLFFEN